MSAVGHAGNKIRLIRIPISPILEAHVIDCWNKANCGHASGYRINVLAKLPQDCHVPADQFFLGAFACRPIAHANRDQRHRGEYEL
jgi:hypothetical protein